MTPSKYVQPELGRFSLGLMFLLLSGSAVLFVDYCLDSVNRTTPDRETSTSSDTYIFFLVGLIYGWTATGSWMLSLIERRYLRWGFQLGLTLIFASVLQVVQEGEWIRFFSSLGGFVFLQTLAFHLLGMPRWQKQNFADKEFLARNQEPTRQFGTGEMLAFTTCVALLLAMVIRYHPDTVDPASYWLPLLAFWCVAPLNAASMIVAILGRQQLGRQIGWVLLSLAMTMICAAGLTLAQYSLTDFPGIPANSFDPWQLARTIGLAYGTLLMTIVAVFAIMASLGRLSSRRVSSRRVSSNQVSSG